ncbi:translocating chain-associated membrane protein 1-like isoform X1 [Homarus americanus]|uniref:Translocating chain-associated membrane protein n=2 Tax=Homarus americanus TaxID=6706 RepID=A0A8J5JRR2_HOMAM|nr:translocating chain-associated membrane protein 1-like isoform X1 [Homarus americanus]KAG7161216.1 Translocating chain-associated membrane protein 1-like 1-like [Homarus americanus]
MALKGVRKSTKNPPILSHEFVIQNHADIVSCVAMIFVLGLMFQATAPMASVFIAVQHNASDMETAEAPMTYTYGSRDTAAVFFYCLISIVMHAIIQEYVLDKVNRKLHLSKTKHSKFNESGQLLIFTAVSAAWGMNILVKDNLMVDITSLWANYPNGHAQMSFMLKFFFIIQMSYWLHCYPELYFQKTKREEMSAKIQHASLYLIFCVAAYVLNFSRVALVLLTLRFVEEGLLHVCRLLYFAERNAAANTGFRVWNVLFVACRLASIIVAILTFHYGLATNDDQSLDTLTGNFNTPFIRLNALVAVCLIQAWMMWNFIHFHLRRMRERQAEAMAIRKKAAEKKTKRGRKDDSKRNSEEDVSELPEVDQQTRRRK